MQNAIDFKELRRQERQRRRRKLASKNNAKTDNGGTAILQSSPPPQSSHPRPPHQSKSNAFASNSPSLAAYESLLPQNKVSEEIHRMKSPANIDSVFYAQHFLAPAQAREVTSWLQSVPEYSERRPGGFPSVKRTEREEIVERNGKWTRLKHARRKVALFDGTVCELPPVLRQLSNTLVAVDAFPSSRPPNHVLINEYLPGEGIMPHTDGPAYESRTATISLGGSDVIFKLWPRRLHTEVHSASVPPLQNQPALEVMLHGNGSLVLFTNDAYINHCHEIREGILEETTGPNGVCGNDVRGGTLVKRGHRFSLTFRCKK